MTAGDEPASPPEVRSQTGATTAAPTAGTTSHRSWRRRSTLAPLALLSRAAAAIRAFVVTGTQVKPRSERRNPRGVEADGIDDQGVLAVQRARA